MEQAESIDKLAWVMPRRGPCSANIIKNTRFRNNTANSTGRTKRFSKPVEFSRKVEFFLFEEIALSNPPSFTTTGSRCNPIAGKPAWERYGWSGKGQSLCLHHFLLKAITHSQAYGLHAHAGIIFLGIQLVYQAQLVPRVDLNAILELITHQCSQSKIPPVHVGLVVYFFVQIHVRVLVPGIKTQSQVWPHTGIEFPVARVGLSQEVHRDLHPPLPEIVFRGPGLHLGMAEVEHHLGLYREVRVQTNIHEPTHGRS